MKYLYVLTSSHGDNYYEQFLLSVTSLKLVMPDTEVILLCDRATAATLTGLRCEYKKNVSDTIIADAPSGMTQTQVSRWLKTSMRRFVAGDFLFIDCDTVITGDLSSASFAGIKFAACLDKHLLFNRHDKKNKIIDRDKKLKFSSYKSNRHFNSGVIYCADIPETHKIFERWHELWLLSNSKKIIMDQNAFNMAIYENPEIITELDGTWNCQISFNGLPYLNEAKIIHYFASYSYLQSSPFTLGTNTILLKIKETGKISDDIIELLKKPKAMFEKETRIVAGAEMLDVLNSSLFNSFLWLRKNKPAVYGILNRAASSFTGIFKRLTKEKGNGL